MEWGDGNSDDGVSGNITHSYTTPGTYTVSITGDFPRIFFNQNTVNTSDAKKILTVEQWGDNSWTSMESAFRGCSNLTIPATDSPNLSTVTDLSSMFFGASSFNQPIDHWDVSNVTTLTSIFAGASSFNQPLDNWDVSRVRNFGSAFSNASAFNQNINQWDVSNSTSMGSMFSQATSFNQPLDSWDVSRVSNFNSVFSNASAFNQNINQWDVSNSTSMESMFSQATSFNQPLDSWDVSNVTSMQSMFTRAESFNQPLDNWNTSSVITMREMFNGAIAFNQPIGSWNVSNVTNMSFLFNDAILFNQPIDTWNTGNVTTMFYMFAGCETFNQPLGSLDVSNVTDMNGMFFEALVFNQPLESWDVGNVTSMLLMFSNTQEFDQPIENWNTVNLLSTFAMFSGAKAFNQPLNNLNVSAVQEMGNMFSSTTSFDQPLNDWDLSQTNNISAIFNDAEAFNQPLDRWDISNITNIASAFNNASAFNQSIETWDVSNVTDMSRLFFNNNLDLEVYDRILNAWANLPNLQQNVNLGANSLTYCLSEESRTRLINEYNWNITGDQENCNPRFINDGFSVIENAPIGTLIGTVSAEDPNQDNSSLVYELISFSSYPSNLGEILAETILFDPESRNITVGENNRFLDFELVRAIRVEISVTDNDNNTATRQFNISLINEFDTPFMTTWVTDKPGVSNDNQITIPTTGEGYNYSVDWGDGNTNEAVTGNITHTYEIPGTYQVSISGDFPRIFFNNEGDKDKIEQIDSWGDMEWTSMESAFAGCSNLRIFTNSAPDLSKVESLSSMFFQSDLSGSRLSWDVHNIKDFSHMFDGVTGFFNGISSWDVSNATDMSFMFANIRLSVDVDNWRTGNLRNASGMFENAIFFDKDISDWDVGNVTNMSRILSGAANFNQNLDKWNISNVTDLSNAFDNSGLFTENYDSILIAWSDLPLQEGVIVGADNVNYCNSADARDQLINQFGWIIIGDNSLCQPNIFNDAILLTENSPIGTVLPAISTSIPSNITFTYSIIDGNINNTFSIDPNSGTIIVIDSIALDFETNSIFNLTIQIETENNFIDSATYRISLLNINEAPIIENQTFMVNENVNAGEKVGSILASDPENDELTFTLLSSNANGNFVVDENGDIVVITSSLDAALNPIITLSVQVSDDVRFRQLSSIATISIELNKVTNVEDISNQISIYPNPATESLSIEYGKLRMQDYQLQIIDNTGKILLNESAKSNVSIASLSGGTYIIRLINNKKVENLRFIKK